MNPSLPPSAKDMLALHGDAITKAGTAFCREAFQEPEATAAVQPETASLDAVDGAVGTYRMLLLHNFGFVGATVTADASGKVMSMQFQKA